MFHKPNKARKGSTWCGPYALAVISGKTYEEAYVFAKKSVPHRRMMGMYNIEVTKAARRMGFKKFEFKMIPKQERCCLRKAIDYMKPNRIYIVNVTNHYIVVNTKDWTLTDSWRDGWEPIATSKMAGRKTKGFAEAYRIPDEHQSPL